MAKVNVTYYLDDVDLSTYGVYVSSSSGLIGKPEAKDPLSEEWEGQSGTMYDLANLKYDSTTIELTCFMGADGLADFEAKAEAFLLAMESGYHTLKVDIDSYVISLENVYIPKETKVTKTWVPMQMAGTFTLKFEQYIPEAPKRLITTYAAPKNVNDNDVHYSVDGVDFANYGVMVTASSGLFSTPNQKDPISVDWEDEDGLQVYKTEPLFEERTIELSCTLAIKTSSDFVRASTEFIRLFSGQGTHRLRVYAGGKPLVYEVYHPSEISVKPTWSNDVNIGTFTLKLKEPEPVKTVIQASGTASITIASTAIAHIYWGDGSHTYDVSGDGEEYTITHTYAEDGNYEIIITCDTSAITNLTTSGTVIWNRLI